MGSFELTVMQETQPLTADPPPPPRRAHGPLAVILLLRTSAFFLLSSAALNESCFYEALRKSRAGARATRREVLLLYQPVFALRNGNKSLFCYVLSKQSSLWSLDSSFAPPTQITNNLLHKQAVIYCVFDDSTQQKLSRDYAWGSTSFFKPLLIHVWPKFVGEAVRGPSQNLRPVDLSHATTTTSSINNLRTTPNVTQATTCFQLSWCCWANPVWAVGEFSLWLDEHDDTWWPDNVGLQSLNFFRVQSISRPVEKYRTSVAGVTLEHVGWGCSTASERLRLAEVVCRIPLWQRLLFTALLPVFLLHGCGVCITLFFFLLLSFTSSTQNVVVNTYVVVDVCLRNVVVETASKQSKKQNVSKRVWEVEESLNLGVVVDDVGSRGTNGGFADILIKSRVEI